MARLEKSRSRLSTLHKNDLIEKRKRNKTDPSGYLTFQKPFCVKDYNKYMGGMDTFDQVSGYYSYPFIDVTNRT